MFHSVRTGKNVALYIGIIWALVVVLIFATSDPFTKEGVDAHVFIGQIESYQANTLLSNVGEVSTRAFKPFYGVVGSWLTPPLSPEVAIVVINLLFLFGLGFVAFYLLRELEFTERFAYIGATWIMTGYPLLKFGIGLRADIGGWFFAVATITMVLIAVRLDSYRLLILASLIGFLGSITKETGAMGLIFGGVYLLSMLTLQDFKDFLKSKEMGVLKKTCYRLLALSLPVLLLQLFLLLVLHRAGMPTFLDWYLLHTSAAYIEKNYRLVLFVGTFVSAFSILIPYALIGLFSSLTSSRRTLFTKPIIRARFFGLLAASLPVLAWTIFISRILYVQFLFIVPIALIGLTVITDALKDRIRSLQLKNMLVYMAILLPIISSVALYLISRGESLFSLIGV